ncbi:SHOCT domain-containing protein [Clostridioides difficile]|nr:SHOCT domain-containing protein [Clostridioides difficile]MBT2159155.1 SHOCT domain-containing protein [Clostridioides difficile]
MIIECNDFILSFDKNDEALATVYKNLIEYRKNNGIGNVSESEVEKNKITNPLEQIKTLKELLDMDAITQEEFDVKKKNY